MITRITKLGTSALVLMLISISCEGNEKSKENTPTIKVETIINEGLRFSESTYPYNGGMLIANFGSSELNPLNSEGKGYISYYKDKKMSVLIKTDGNLNAPKGMVERDGLLYICDVNKVVVYDLSNISIEPKTIKFKEGELFLNDIVHFGNDLFVSVTNSGNIYKINIANTDDIGSLIPILWSNVTGANGLVIDGNKMYIASYPADGVTTDNNVVYVIEDINTPNPEKLISKPGQYDGLALSKDSKWLYVSNWSAAGIISINLATKKVEPISIKTKLAGPADISIDNNKLYIPDLPNSQIVIVEGL